MTRPQAVELGPFIGGLNTISDDTAVDDSEAVECVNFIVDLDGSLKCRPAIVGTENNQTTEYASSAKIIGRARFTGASEEYLIVSNSTGTYILYDTGDDFWNCSVILDNLYSDVAIQYLDNVYIVARQDSAVGGGRWNGTFTADASMPRGKAAVFHKSRLWVVPGEGNVSNPSRLIFSDVITSVTLSWPSTNNIDIQPGDGDNLIDLCIYNDNIILFKENSIYLLAYDVSPTDAVLRKVVDGIGVVKQFCLDTYENSIFFLHEGNVYEMSNYEFKRINDKVPFELDKEYSGRVSGISVAVNLQPTWLRRMGDLLLVGFFTKRYCYSLLTRTWTEWQSEDDLLMTFGPPVEIPNTTTTNESPYYYALSTADDWASQLFRLTDEYVPGTQDFVTDTGLAHPITSWVKTKSYDFEVPLMWKRLLWWGVKAFTKNTIKGQVYVNLTGLSDVYWEDLLSYNWNELEGTWDSINNSFIITTEHSGSSDNVSKFYKFQKTCRFQTVSFKISLTNDNTSTEGPARLLEGTAIVGLKQVVEKGKNFDASV